MSTHVTVGFVGSQSSLFMEQGTPLLRSQNVRPGMLVLTGLKYISPATHQLWRKSSLQGGDVVIVRVGANVGTTAVIPTGLGELNAASMVIVRPNPSLLSGRYLSYLLNSPWGHATVDGLVVGSAQPVLNARTVASMKVPLPPLPTQRKIAAILSAYDDLIENNSRRIKLLEEIAQRIYREWFVNFRYPGHENVPLVDSALGLIPQGWEVAELATLTEVITRGVSPSYAEKSDQLVINQRCIRGGALDLAPARPHSSTVPPTKMVRVSDILINSTGVGTLGRVAQVLFVPTGLTVDSHVTIVRPLRTLVDTDFFGVTMLTREPEITAMGIGSTGQTELGRAAIGQIKVVVPPLRCQQEFSNAVGAIRCLPISLAAETVTLRSTRDLLLPRLISGEIDVADLDIAMPEVAA